MPKLVLKIRACLANLLDVEAPVLCYTLYICNILRWKKHVSINFGFVGTPNAIDRLGTSYPLYLFLHPKLSSNITNGLNLLSPRCLLFRYCQFLLRTLPFGAFTQRLSFLFRTVYFSRRPYCPPLYCNPSFVL